MYIPNPNTILCMVYFSNTILSYNHSNTKDKQGITQTLKNKVPLLNL